LPTWLTPSPPPRRGAALVSAPTYCCDRSCESPARRAPGTRNPPRRRRSPARLPTPAATARLPSTRCRCPPGRRRPAHAP